MESFRLVLSVIVSLAHLGLPVHASDAKFCAYAFKDNPYACQYSHVYKKCQHECDDRQLNCFKCSSVEDPSHCQTTTICGPSQACSMTGFIDQSFRKRYALGCANTTQCNIFHESRHTRNELHMPGYCCKQDKCNSNLVKSTDPLSVSKECRDATPYACQYMLDKNQNICDHHATAREICAAMCGECHGPLSCLNCTDLGENEICKTFESCDNGKVCSAMANAHDAVCCNTHSCNNQVLLLSNLSAKTTVPMNCGVDFVQVGGTCYYLNPEGRTEIWEDAKVICMALDSQLVEFETERELMEMKNYLISKHGYDRHYSYWIGGKKNPQSSSWEWDSSNSPILTTAWFGDKDSNTQGECLEYGAMYDFKWYGGRCHLQSNFICEKK
ncbi:COLEC12 [Mytilus edulis]|uniref:COLEC12 n=1 Tax=Mytilus edulis TaxID=6550 RepID=A0A8S3T706_MYTED|nr:COLEC12 [Mytilus edulis]